MGKVADSAIRKRRKRRTDDLARRASARAVPQSEAEVFARRTRVAVAEVRRAVRTQQLAKDAIDSADQRAACGVRVLFDGGRSRPEIAAMCGVPLWTVRRLLALTTPTDPAAAPAGGDDG